jgi:hypothetical protein
LIAAHYCFAVHNSGAREKRIQCCDSCAATVRRICAPRVLAPDPLLRRNEGCRVEGSVCYKDSPDCQWSVALAKHGAGDRQVWALKVGGRCGRMAIGLALDVDEVRHDKFAQRRRA